MPLHALLRPVGASPIFLLLAPGRRSYVALLGWPGTGPSAHFKELPATVMPLNSAGGDIFPWRAACAPKLQRRRKLAKLSQNSVQGPFSAPKVQGQPQPGGPRPQVVVQKNGTPKVCFNRFGFRLIHAFSVRVGGAIPTNSWLKSGDFRGFTPEMRGCGRDRFDGG